MRFYSLPTSSALLAFVLFTTAAPTSSEAAFSVEQVARGHKVLSGPLQVLRTYRKHARLGLKVSTDVVAAARKATGEVPALPAQYDQNYLSPVSIGGQKLYLDFDTGSADLWTFSTLLPKKQVKGQTLYNPGVSKTARELKGYSFNISYGSGDTAGVVYADRVAVGGVTATSQAVEVATTVSEQFTDDSDRDGILGLAFSSINTVQPRPQLNFFDTVSPKLARKLFTASLKHGRPGSYDFGYIDGSKYSGDIVYSAVNSSQGNWQFEVDQYAIGDAPPSGKIGPAFVDTGSSLMYLSPAATAAYYSKVEGGHYSSTAGGFIVPCNAMLPDFHMSIAGRNFTVLGQYLNYAPVNRAGKMCFGGVQPNGGFDLSILGDTFLKSVFVVFDQSQAEPRIGVAKPRFGDKRLRVASVEG